MKNTNMENTTMQTNFTDTSARNGYGPARPEAHAPLLSDAGLTSGNVAAAPHDLLTRLRDKWGNRLGWASVFSIPTIDDVSLEETPLASGLSVITAQSPVRAATLHHFYDFKLCPALRRFWHVLEEETARQAERNATAVQRNVEITAKQEALETGRDAATLPDREALTALEDGPLAEAHADASEKVARTGGTYDPQNPSEDCALRHSRRSLEVLAAEQSLPGPHGDTPAHMSRWFQAAVTAAVGTMVGLSLGIATNVLEADTLARHLPLAGIFIVLGICLAALSERAVHGSWYRVGQDYYLGCSRAKWATMIVIAVAVSLLVLGVDVFLERKGLLALMQLMSDTQALSGAAPSQSALEDIGSIVVPMVVSLPYLCFFGGIGYLDGRDQEVKNRLLARQDQEWMETDAARRADTVVQTALHALAHVREMLRRRDGLTARVTALAAPFDAKIAALEGERLPENEEIDDAARRRVQDALDNFHGAQYTFDVMWEEALADCEGVGGGWANRLRRAFGGYRPPRRTRREERARGEK